jgi:hypothetical protein
MLTPNNVLDEITILLLALGLALVFFNSSLVWPAFQLLKWWFTHWLIYYLFDHVLSIGIQS